MGVRSQENATRGTVASVVYVYESAGPDSVWTIDCARASVGAGETKKPECTLELTDADFLAMCSGEKDAQKMYFAGELKVGGDIMASQKLTFLQKVEERHVKLAMDERAAGGGAGAAAAAAGGTKREASAAKLFAGLKPSGTGKIQFLVTDPDGAWFVDLGAGDVKSGTYEGADATFTVSDEGLGELAAGELTPAQLFQMGKLRVDGDMALARDLTWLQPS